VLRPSSHPASPMYLEEVSPKCTIENLHSTGEEIGSTALTMELRFFARSLRLRVLSLHAPSQQLRSLGCTFVFIQKNLPRPLNSAYTMPSQRD
jgi:hypothetical protein